MLKPRVPETNEGIQSELTVEQFDIFARHMRDKGWNGVDDMLACGIEAGELLELGPGPGYVGLELARRLGLKAFTACEISPAMIAAAERNAKQYGIDARYVLGNVMELPFPDGSFDCVISNGSLHEWEEPKRVFSEIWRVLRTGGRYCICDMRRDAEKWKTLFILASTRPRAMRAGCKSSLAAAYTPSEIRGILDSTELAGAKVKSEFFGLTIWGTKS